MYPLEGTVLILSIIISRSRLKLGQIGEMNSHKPNGFFPDSFIYISQNVLHVSDLFTYIMIVKYMINRSLNKIGSGWVKN